MNGDRFSEARTAYLFLAPIAIVVGLFVLWPVISTFYGSLFRDITYLPKEFIGLKNFADILAKGDFWAATRFTLLFTLVAVVLEAALGMAFALLLNEPFKGRGILRAVVLVPWAIPTIVSAKIWKLVFDYTYGVLNWLVMNLGVSADKINWLGTSATAFWSIVAAEVWKTTPFMVIIVLAGLQAIPQDLYKQAAIDGAGVMKRFWSVTLPLVWPVLTVSLIFRTIDSLRISDLVYVLTGGGPGGATKTLSMMGFEYYANDAFGRGSTVSVITFLIVFAITLAYIRMGKFDRTINA